MIRTAARTLLLSLLAGACLLAAGCGKSDPTSALGQERLVTFGHAWVKGRTPDRTITPWPEQVATRLGWVVDNLGSSGATSDRINRAVQAYDVSPADTVVVEPILGDVGRRGPRGLSEYRANLQAMLRHLTRGTTAPAQVIVLADPPITDWGAFRPKRGGSNRVLASYVEATREIATAFPVTFVDLGVGWTPDLDVTPVDGAHPSAAGTEKIRDKVAAAIREHAAQTKDAK
jgi:lysophospholipase L1-like esterase